MLMIHQKNYIYNRDLTEYKYIYDKKNNFNKLFIKFKLLGMNFHETKL